MYKHIYRYVIHSLETLEMRTNCVAIKIIKAMPLQKHEYFIMKVNKGKNKIVTDMIIIYIQTMLIIEIDKE